MPSLLRLLRVLLWAVPLAFVLGGGCVFVWHDDDDDHDDHDDDDTVIIISETGASGGTAGAPAPDTGGLDPALFELGECELELDEGTDGPVLVRATEIRELSPARVWPAAEIGDRQLAAFAAIVLRVNEERLRLPVPTTELHYLDSILAGDGDRARDDQGDVTVLFGRRPAADALARAMAFERASVASAGAELACRFAPTGELVAIERLPGERLPGDRASRLR